MIRYVPIQPVLIFFDEELMTERLNDRLIQSKNATAIDSMDAENPQDGDVCEFFGFDLDNPAFHEYWYTPEYMSNPQAGLYATYTPKQKGVNKEHLQKIWIISEDEARHTIKVTTQLNMQDADSNLSHAISSNDRMLRYKRINQFFFTDNLFGKKSARGYICMNIFVSDKGFVKVYDMKSRPNSLNR